MSPSLLNGLPCLMTSGRNNTRKYAFSNLFQCWRFRLSLLSSFFSCIPAHLHKAFFLASLSLVRFCLCEVRLTFFQEFFFLQLLRNKRTSRNFRQLWLRHTVFLISFHIFPFSPSSVIVIRLHVVLISLHCEIFADSNSWSNSWYVRHTSRI